MGNDWYWIRPSKQPSCHFYMIVNTFKWHMLASGDNWCDGNSLWVNIYLISRNCKNWWEIDNIGTLQCAATLLSKSTVLLLIWKARTLCGHHWFYKCLNTDFPISRLKMNIWENLTLLVIIRSVILFSPHKYFQVRFEALWILLTC